jgi:hypothetical protein
MFSIARFLTDLLSLSCSHSRSPQESWKRVLEITNLVSTPNTYKHVEKIKPCKSVCISLVKREMIGASTGGLGGTRGDADMEEARASSNERASQAKPSPPQLARPNAVRASPLAAPGSNPLGGMGANARPALLAMRQRLPTRRVAWAARRSFTDAPGPVELKSPSGVTDWLAATAHISRSRQPGRITSWAAPSGSRRRASRSPAPRRAASRLLLRAQVGRRPEKRLS